MLFYILTFEMNFATQSACIIKCSNVYTEMFMLNLFNNISLSTTRTIGKIHSTYVSLKATYRTICILKVAFEVLLTTDDEVELLPEHGGVE